MSDVIKLTDRAVLELKRYMEDSRSTPESHILRVAVVSGGCSGFSYQLELEERSKIDALNDTVVQFGDITAAVDNKSSALLEGTEIDFYEGLDARGFKFSNPQAKRGCGCNKSFDV